MWKKDDQKGKLPQNNLKIFFLNNVTEPLTLNLLDPSIYAPQFSFSEGSFPGLLRTFDSRVEDPLFWKHVKVCVLQLEAVCKEVSNLKSKTKRHGL